MSVVFWWVLHALCCCCLWLLCCVKAIEWVGVRSDKDMVSRREAMIQELEKADFLMAQSGMKKNWLEMSDEEVKRISG